MRFRTLDQWLSWQEMLHPKAIDLGLERPGEVMRRMGLSAQPSHATITVAGTNGKGSTVAMLESILLAAGYRVGTYTSPHLIRYNERVRIGGVEVADEDWCNAFAQVDQARGDVSLSYFEFGTLAAFYLLEKADLDVAVLEVGMGGRLDAVNLIDPDVALLTPIDVDHAEWLGPDRECIAREKAGIFRAGRSAVCNDPEPPARVQAEADRIGASLHQLGRDFHFRIQGEHWSWQGTDQRRDGLPWPALRGASQPQNAAGVLMALELLSERLPVQQQHVRAGLLSVQLPGRFQVVPGPVTRIFDVGHNPHAARELVRNLQKFPATGRTLLVIAMLGDKDCESVVAILSGHVNVWFAAGLTGPRGAGPERLAAAIAAQGGAVQSHIHVRAACDAALKAARPGDRVVVWGSFHTVAEALTTPV